MMMVNVKERRVRVVNEGEGNRSRLLSSRLSFPSLLLVSPQCLLSVSPVDVRAFQVCLETRRRLIRQLDAP